MQKIVLITVFICLANTSIIAQSVITPALSDTVLLSDTREADLKTFKKGSDEPLTATVVEYHINGRLKLRKSVVNGKSHGLWMEWYESGIPRYIGEWKEGLGHGTWIYFHENGEISERAEVEDDIWQGVAEGWHKNGQKAFEGFYVNYNKEGRWTYWKEDGSIDSTKTKAY